MVGGHRHDRHGDHDDERHLDHDRDDHRREPRRDLDLHAAMLHLVSDTAASAGVVVSGIVITVRGGWHWLDPVVSLLIGASIAAHAWRLLRSSNAVLLEGVPEGLDVADLRAARVAVPGVEAVHDLHVWAIASHFAALPAHVVVPSGSTLQDAQPVASEVRRLLAAGFGIEHPTLELDARARGGAVRARRARVRPAGRRRTGAAPARTALGTPHHPAPPGAGLRCTGRPRHRAAWRRRRA